MTKPKEVYKVEIKNPLDKNNYLAFNKLLYPIIGIKANYEIFFLNDAAKKEYLPNGLSEDEVYGKGYKCFQLLNNYDRPCNELGDDCPIKEVPDKKVALMTKHSGNGCMYMVEIDKDAKNGLFFETHFDILPLISEIKEIFVKDGKNLHVQTYTDEIREMFLSGKSIKEISDKTGKNPVEIAKIISKIRE